ncbi:hypothetical protein MHTCC0001_33220 [Flavobacteriaceae bacterium MHTCC 0001]
MKTISLIFILILPLWAFSQVQNDQDISNQTATSNTSFVAHDISKGFKFYPNPVKDVLNIELDKGLELKRINVYNLQYQYLYYAIGLKVDIRNLKSGVYFLEVETDKGIFYKRMIKKA